MRIEEIKDYIVGIISDILNNNNYVMNIDFLSNEVNSYSIDKIPTDTNIEKWLNELKINSNPNYAYTISLESIEKIKSYLNSVEDDFFFCFRSVFNFLLLLKFRFYLTFRIE